MYVMDVWASLLKQARTINLIEGIGDNQSIAILRSLHFVDDTSYFVLKNREYFGN